jgi:Na+/proline symporter
LRKRSVVITTALALLMAACPLLTTTPSQAVGIELLGGTLGGAVGAASGVVALGGRASNRDSRAARIATIIAGVTLGSGLGATAGVLVAGRLLKVDGNVPGCLLGALVSALVEPLLYLFGTPERATEFLGLLFLPIAPAVGATIGFNWGNPNPR